MIRFRLRLNLQEYELSPGTTIVGRGDTCNLTIDDALLSREHARISLSSGRVTLRDLGSRNGTYVNGERVADDVELRDGDRVKVGATEMLFSRVLTPRRDVIATASIRTCGSCRTTHVAQAPNCPRCGAIATPAGPPPSESQRRRDFWLQLEVELLEKAMAMFRLDEANESLARLMQKLDELIDAGKTFEIEQLDAALAAAVRHGRNHGNGRAIAWAFSVLRRLNRLPSPPLFALIAATAPILLEDAVGDLQTLLDSQRTRTLTVVERSCLESLERMRDELRVFALQRTAETKRHRALEL